MCKSGIIVVNVLIFCESSCKTFRQIFVFIFIHLGDPEMGHNLFYIIHIVVGVLLMH